MKDSLQPSPNTSWWVYILECQDGTLYTGITKDVTARFNEHCQGLGAKYTRAHPPRRVAYREVAQSRSEALKRELALKRLSRTEKLSFLALSGE